MQDSNQIFLRAANEVFRDSLMRPEPVHLAIERAHLILHVLSSAAEFCGTDENVARIYEMKDDFTSSVETLYDLEYLGGKE